MDTTAAEALVPVITYEDVTDFVPGYTRVERTLNDDGTQSVRQVAVAGYEITKRIATVELVAVGSTTQRERKSIPPEAARVGRQDDLSAFDNLVILDGAAGADTVDLQLYGSQDGSLADGSISTTTDRDILIRALKAVYGQSYTPSESELIPVDSIDNQRYGWLSGFGGNRQGIVLDNIELMRMQLGSAINNVVVDGVDVDIKNLVLSLGGGDDVLQVGRLETLEDENGLGDGKLIGLSVDTLNPALRAWFASKQTAPSEQPDVTNIAYLDDQGLNDRHLLVTAVREGIPLGVEALEAWYNGANLANADFYAQIDLELANADSAMAGLDVADQTQDVQTWLATKAEDLASHSRTQLQLLAWAIQQKVPLSSTDLDQYYSGIDLTAINGSDVDEAWNLQNGPLYRLTVLDQPKAVRDWLDVRKPALELLGLTQLNFLTAAVIDDISLTDSQSVALLTINYDTPGRLAHIKAIAADLDNQWKLANPRIGGIIGSLEDILSRAVLIGGTGDDTVRIFDSARADALLVQVSATTLKPFYPEDPSVATAMEIAANPLQQRIDFMQIDISPRNDPDGPSGAIAINGFKFTELYLGTGNDKIEITSAVLPLYVAAGGGDDDFFVGSTPDDALTSSLDGIRNTILTLDGGTGSTRLVVSRGGDEDPTATVELTENSIIVNHFTSDDRSIAPVNSSVIYRSVKPNEGLSVPPLLTAGAYRGEARLGFDRGVVLYTGDGNDTSVQIKSMRSEAPTMVYLGAGADSASVLDNFNFGVNTGLRNTITGDPHDLLQVFGGAGDDRIDLSKALVGVRAFGGGDDDVLLGSTGVDILIGGLGNDQIQGYGASLLSTPGIDELWGQQLEVLVGDDLGRLFTVEETTSTGTPYSVTYRLPGFIDRNSQYFDERWMEGGGVYLFDRTDSPGQLYNLADSVDERGVLLRNGEKNYRGGDPNATWLSLTSPSNTLDMGGNDIIFSGVALPTLNGLATNTLQTIAALSGTNVVFGGAGRDKIFLGNANEKHGHGHIIIGDEAQVRLNEITPEGTTRMLDAEDIAAAKGPQFMKPGDDWIQYGSGDAYVLAGRGHDTVLGGLAPDGTDTAELNRHRILSDMGIIRLVNDTTEIRFMEAAPDRVGADDTVVVGADDVDWIGGAGSDRIWVGFEMDIDATAAGAIEPQFDGRDGEAGLRIGQVFGAVPPAQDLQTPRLWLGTEVTATGDFAWTPRVTAVAVPPLSKRTQAVNLIADYGFFKRDTLLADKEIYGITAGPLFDMTGAAPVILVASSSAPNNDFDHIYDNAIGLPDAIVLEPAKRASLRGDGGSDRVVLGSASGNVILGDGNDSLIAEDTRSADAYDPAIGSGPATGEEGLVVLADAGELHRFLGLAGSLLDANRLIRAVSSTDETPVGANGDTDLDQQFTGGDDVVDLGKGHHVVVGGSGKDTLRVAADTDDTVDIDDASTYLRQIVSGDTARMIFDVRSTVPPRTILYYATDEGSGDTANPFSEDVSDDNITIGSGDILATGGLGADVITTGRGRHILAGDQLEINTQFWVDPPSRLQSFSRMTVEDASTEVYGGGDTIVSSARIVLAIGGEGNDFLELQNGMTAAEAGRAMVMGGRGIFEFEHDQLAPGDVMLGTTRAIPDMFETETLAFARTLDVSEEGIGGSDDDKISLGHDRRVVFGGKGKDIIEAGDGRSIVAGDSAVLTLTPTTDDFVLSSFWTAGYDQGSVINNGADDVIKLGAGDATVIGGLGADKININFAEIDPLAFTYVVIGDSGAVTPTQDAADSAALGEAVNNGPIARLAIMETWDTAIARTGGDTITTGAGWARLLGGGGGDIMTTGDGEGLVIGDNGRLTFNPEVTAFTERDIRRLVEIASLASANSVAFGGEDEWRGGNGLHIAAMGGASDTVKVGNGDARLLLDFGYMTQTIFGDPIIAEDKSVVHGDGDTATFGDAGSAHLVLGGQGSDDINGGNGNAVVLGDNGKVVFDPTTQTPLNSVSNLPVGSTFAQTHAISGNDTVDLGQGSKQVVFGGAGNDTIVTQVDEDGILLASAPGNSSFFAGDFAELIFDPAYGAMLRFTGKDDALAFADRDRFTTGDGPVWAILGSGTDDLTHGDGLAHVLGDNGEMITDPTSLILTRMEAQTSNPAAVKGGVDTWIGGNGEHLGIMGAAGDHVNLRDGAATLLLDHGVIERAANGDLARVADLNPELGGDDTAYIGASFGVIAGGAGDDRIEVGRTATGALDPLDGTQIIFGDTGHVLFDPSLLGNMDPVLIENLLPEVAGADFIRAGAGRDISMGGAGADDIHSEAGRDITGGDFLQIRYGGGLAVELQTPQQFQLAGAGDVLRSGYDGDFVLGGTQFNRFDTASSVDITFETFARILFQPGQGIDKVLRMENQGVSGSLLDDRVQSGQTGSDSGGASGITRFESNANFGVQSDAGVSELSFLNFLQTFLSFVNDSASNGGLAAIFVDEAGRLRHNPDASNSLSEFLKDSDGALLTPNAIEEMLNLLEQVGPDLPQGEKVAPPPDEVPAEGQSLEKEASLLQGNGQQAYLRGGASNDVLNPSGREMADDYFSVVSIGAAVAAVAGAKHLNGQTGGHSYRRYSARNVVSLEQRLRVWQDDKFGLRLFEEH